MKKRCKKCGSIKVIHGIKNPQLVCLKCKAASLRRTRIKYAGGAAAYRRMHRDKSKANYKKYLANKLIEGRIRRGVLLKQPCEVCKSTKTVHAHHEDYSKPLDIVWLCPKHHKERHANDR